MKTIPIVLVLGLCGFVVADRKLLFVQTVFRHGSRAPLDELTSPEAEKYYFRGLGELTNKGISQGNRLGTVLRNRYVTNGFLDSRYFPKQVSFVSSASPRCTQTTQAVASAMFDPTDDGVPIPIPVSTTPRDEDYLLVPKVQCPFQWKIMNTEMNLPDETTDFDVLWRALAKKYGKIELPEDMKDPEAYLVEKRDNLPLPNWFNKTVVQEIERQSYQFLSYLTGTGLYHNPVFIKVKSGLLLHTIQEEMKLAWKCSLDSAGDDCKEFRSGKKFMGYGTHDITLLALAESLAVTNATIGVGSLADYGAAFSFELWKINGIPEIKVFYRRRPSDANFIEVTQKVRGCVGSKCKLEQFVDCCNEFTTTEPEKMCPMGSEKKENSTTYGPLTWVLLTFSIVSFILFTFITYLYTNLRRRVGKETDFHCSDVQL